MRFEVLKAVEISMVVFLLVGTNILKIHTAIFKAEAPMVRC
jgi:hypothetical protein